jgi:beta-lactamase class A
MKEVEKGTINLEQKYKYYPQDFSDGTGILVHNKYGTNFTLETLLNTLLKESDNVSQNILIRSLPKSSIKDAFSIISQKDYFNDNVATAAEISNYYETLYKGNYLSEEDKAYLLELLSNLFDDRLRKT